MAPHSIEHLHDNELRDRLEGDLLAAILSERAYPWEPSEPAAADYFDSSATAFDLGDWSEEEIVPRAAALFAQLDRCWASPASVPAALLEQFGDRVPRDWLAAIAEQARTVATSTLAPLDRLVACVQPLLSEWAVEDLQVFARPFAYAMRGEEAAPLAAQPWEALSPVEQARCTLAIAQCALDAVQADR